MCGTKKSFNKQNIAFLYTSKAGVISSINNQDLLISQEEDEPPPDLLSECDSDETISAIINVLEQKYNVYPIEADIYAYDKLRNLKPDLVFNIAERLNGPNRESHIPILCEMLEIPYTGSDPLTLGICLVKSRAKEILSYYKIANPEFFIINDIKELPNKGLLHNKEVCPNKRLLHNEKIGQNKSLNNIKLPVMVKPLYEGSSKGIKDDCLVYNNDDLYLRITEKIKLYKQPVIIEQFLSGREFTVGILGNYPNIEVLPIVEINHGSLPKGANPIYSYEAKWIWDTADKPLDIFSCPANISEKLKNQIETLVIKTCIALNIKDWARIDVRLDQSENPNIIEVNPLPGILPTAEENSCLPKAARAAGYTYSDLILRVIKEALKRNEAF